jgi:hypothetical protein
VAANGEQINTGALTAAHKSLPFGTLVRVTNSDAEINDRDLYVKGHPCWCARSGWIACPGDVALITLVTSFLYWLDRRTGRRGEWPG